tara:strand:+ start:20 stop:370 length:351 start_codon:yes stop_codon:yes gene_type:complete
MVNNHKKRKSESRQFYYNIAIGVTISLLVAIILGGAGWVTKMQVTVNKADLALREVERNSKAIKEKNTVLHRRITATDVYLKALEKQYWFARVEQAEINGYNRAWIELLKKGLERH